MQVLHEIALRGSTVIMSIHQPSFRILNLLDRTIFLSRGRSIYYGSPQNLPKFFSEFGMPIPKEQNPAEFTLDLVHDLQEDERTDPTTIRRLISFNRTWGQSAVCDSNGASWRASFNSVPNARLVDGTMPNYSNNCWTEVSNSII
jgi:ABC-type multidrug transport system ATPase subunit